MVEIKLSKLFPPSNGEGYIFITVCFSVCLSLVIDMTENWRIGFSLKNFRICETWHKQWPANFWDVTSNPFHTGFLGGKACLLATLWKNKRSDFHEIFRIGHTWHKELLVMFDQQDNHKMHFYLISIFCQSNYNLVGPAHRNNKSYLFLPNYHHNLCLLSPYAFSWRWRPGFPSHHALEWSRETHDCCLSY